MKVNSKPTVTIPLDDDIEESQKLMKHLPNVNSRKDSNPMKYPGSPKTVLYKVEGHYTDPNTPIVDVSDVEALDKLFTPDGDIVGADPINYDTQRTPISRWPEKIDPVEYINIWLDDNDETRGDRNQWCKFYQNGYINGEPVSKHYFGN